jgi:type IV pilus assembly protein PilV
MVTMRASFMSAQRGTTMLEVLVTIVILAFGLLGLVGLQSRLQVSEMEAYQRAQALILLENMADRIAVNRQAANSYVTGTDTPLGTGNTCTLNGSSTLQEKSSCEWNNALQGAAERSGTSSVGALIGGRGCIEALPNNAYLITVAWQGNGPVARPANDALLCGKNAYDGGANPNCTNDLCRRTISTTVQIGTLS